MSSLSRLDLALAAQRDPEPASIRGSTGKVVRNVSAGWPRQMLLEAMPDSGVPGPDGPRLDQAGGATHPR